MARRRLMTHDSFNENNLHPQREESLSPLFRTLSPEEQKRAKQLATNLQFDRYEDILNFGAEAQAALASFSHRMLSHVQRKDVLKVGDVLNQLMERLEMIDPETLYPEKAGFFGRIFGKAPATIQQKMTQFQKLGTQIDRLGIQLEYAKNSLIDDLSMLDELYSLNSSYYEELVVYIAAAELKKQEALTTTLPALQEHALNTQDVMVQQKAQDLAGMIERLDQRLYDLELSKQLTLQTAPQIRLMQQTNQQLAEKIQMSILTSIPLWKNQISMLLTMNNQRRAATAQRKMAQATNEMIKKKSKLAQETARTTSIEQDQTLEEIHALKHTQKALVEMIEETIKLQSVGYEKRLEIEQDIRTLESDQQQLIRKL